MKTVLKFATAAAVTGALALASVTPSEARSGRTVGAAAIGFGAGALVGAAIAGSANRGQYYYGEPGYAYRSGGYGYRSSPYAYRSRPYAYETYAYEPAYAEPVYVEPAPRYYQGSTRGSSGNTCGMSPASPNYTSCN